MAQANEYRAQVKTRDESGAAVDATSAKYDAAA